MELHLTDRFINKSADELIEKLQKENSTLRQQNAANEEYIQELEENICELKEHGRNPEYEETIKNLKEEIDNLENIKKSMSGNLSAVNKKYQQLLDDPDGFCKPLKEEIIELKQDLKKLIKQRDQLIFQLHKNDCL